MPRSTKVVKEDFPDALTKPLEGYWWSREGVRVEDSVVTVNIMFIEIQHQNSSCKIWMFYDGPLTSWTDYHEFKCAGLDGWNDGKWGTHKNKPGI